MSTNTLTTLENVDREWWKEAVVYQIYPRSFSDTDGDGVGDLQGIVDKVDYIDSLGVDLVWLCPVYGSPNEDNGYDISDYHAIMDEFGDMADWERLLDELHDRDIRLIMDLVLNHTSSEHEWFQRSRRGEGEYADYYYWRDGRPATDADYDTDDGPADEVAPNNWDSIFGGPAWSYVEEREQWYLHLFDENQPDLNWRNPTVRQAMKDVVSWWLDRGIDGFRMDAVSHMSKTDGLPDGDPEGTPTGIEHFSHGPRLEEYLTELSADVLSDHDITTVAEMGHTLIEQAADYLDDEAIGLDMIFQFSHMGVDGGWDPETVGEWDLPEFKRIMSERQDALADRGWDALFLGNHDQPRIVSRFGDEAYHRESASLIGTFLLTMRGTPYVYQGEEIGMTNADFESLDEIDDPQTVGRVEQYIADGVADSYEELREVVNARSRDHARTPMQWSDEPGAGFTDGEPWLKCNADYTEINVAAQRDDPASVLNQYRRLIDLRQSTDVLVYGDYELLAPEDDQLYAYTRTLDDERALVVLNWSSEPATFEGSEIEVDDPTVLYGNYDDAPTEPTNVSLRPWEAVVYRL
ncbi:MULTISPECIES: glycoside hydrolase family 13 protein [Halomicrobium]|uniref:Alpha amylase catalytic region n=2 Tax=Halomicrobium mukohataei TaxID=57705 RepID=C7NVT8_HALMD|nr:MULTISPECIES: alpha-glucosidase [Halomicrobium]ACV46203.1 alpha amylase catalytic region [Halomicrobium mukohataei DSM 12286]QCD64768.1 alpha-glucosidase [Halomicrobium mukohataei]QFR19575.1 alpha,alpha-phosphotrehalase [Halomicrobium sp. ZPS1]